MQFRTLDILCNSADRRVPFDADVLRQWVSRESRGRVELEACCQQHAYRCYYPPRLDTSGTQYFDEYGEPEDRYHTQDIATRDDFGVDGWKAWATHKAKSNPLPLAMLLRLEASKLMAPSVSEPDRSAMSVDGTGMHVALNSMCNSDPDSWQALQANLRAIISTIKRIRLSVFDPGHVSHLLFDTVGAGGLAAEEVSEGTLLVS